MTKLYFSLLIIIGLALRFYAGTFGYTQDLDYANRTLNLYKIGNWDQLTSGPWVTSGPISLYLLIVLSYLPISLGWILTFWNSCIDIAITCMLWWRFNLVAATLFFLNPISIVVTGYQRVGDASVIALGLGSMLLYESGKLWTSILIFSISLLYKPTLLLLPIWLILYPKCSWKSRIILILPCLVWVIGIWLYAPNMFNGLQNYISTNNAPFWNTFDIGHITKWFGYKELMIISMCCCGLWYRKYKPLEMFSIYTICIVVYAAALANHYLIIPISGLVMSWNRWVMLYLILGGLFEFSSSEGLHIPWLQKWFPVSGDTSLALPIYHLLIVILMIHLATRERLAYDIN